MSSKLDLENVIPHVFSFQLLLGFLQILDYMKIEYYYTIHRRTQVDVFKLNFNFIIPFVILIIIWVLNCFQNNQLKSLFTLLPISLIIYSYNLAFSVTSIFMGLVGTYYIKERSKVYSGIAWILTFCNALSVIHWGIFLPFNLPSPFEPIVKITLGLFWIFSIFSPILLLPILFILIIRPILNLNINCSPHVYAIEEKKMTSKSWLLLITALLIAVIGAIYPWLPSINPGKQDFGVDIHWYTSWVDSVWNDHSQLFKVNWGSRPIIILLIMGFQKITGFETIDAVRYIPIILLPLLVFSVFFMSWHLLKNSEIAIWSAFLTSTGIQLTIGMYAYFLTNIFALTLISFSLAYLFQSLKNTNYFQATIAAFFGGLVTYTHPWTFIQYIVPLIILLLIIFYKEITNERHNNNSKIILFYLLFSFTFEFIRMFLFKGMGIISASNILVESIIKATGYWNSNILFFRLYYGGFASNSLLLLLVLMGSYFIVEKNETLFFNLLLLVTGIVYLFVDVSAKSRLIYNLPLGFFAAYGIKIILKRPKSLVYKMWIITSSLNYFLMCLANMV